MLLLLCGIVPTRAQKLIEYEAGMGTRDPNNSDVWILYRRVRATHEGMTLYADSALLNTKRNDFTAFRNVKIILSDTTTIWGDELYYDGQKRIADIWGKKGKKVKLKDGATTLTTDRLTYDRNQNTAFYENGGHATNRADTLDSRIGRYNTDLNTFFIYGEVQLKDSTSLLVTDTLVFNTETNLATFTSPTHIYSDSATLYSEAGNYDSGIDYARSYKNSHVKSGEKTLMCDTLFYNKRSQFGQAWGHVFIFDSINDITCRGRYGETDQSNKTSFVTDSALVVFVDKGDSLYLHADTIFTTNNSDQKFETVRANYHVKIFRHDAQALCDSVFYSQPDSVVRLYYSPVLWYNDYQCSSDTMEIFLDTAGVRQANLNNNVMAIEKMDEDKHNQVKGRNTIVYFTEGEPNYADVLGSAQMVYYLTEQQPDSTQALVGVNVGQGSSMRIYFKDRQPEKVSTYGKPDMTAYPYDKLPSDKRHLPGFEWKENQRPKSPKDIFIEENIGRKTDR